MIILLGLTAVLASGCAGGGEKTTADNDTAETTQISEDFNEVSAMESMDPDAKELVEATSAENLSDVKTLAGHDTYEEYLSSNLKIYFRDNYKIEETSTGRYKVWAWSDKLTAAANKALAGDADTIDAWRGFMKDFDGIVENCYYAYQVYDLPTGDNDFTFLVTSDSSPENVLIEYISGERMWDAVDGQ